MNDLARRLNDIPPVTRFFTIVVIAIGLAMPLKLISDERILVEYFTVADAFQWGLYNTKYYTLWSKVWYWATKLLNLYRLFTTFFVTRGSLTNNAMSSVMDIYLFYTFSKHLEKGKFKGVFPDYLWFVLVCGALITFLSFACEYLCMENGSGNNIIVNRYSLLLSCVTYMWLRELKNSVINFLNVVPIKAYYLPLFDLGILIMGGPFYTPVLGILCGYFYQCIQSDTLPIYNLLLGVYGRFNPANDRGRRVGSAATRTVIETIPDAIFDKGHLKAPSWLYKLLKYPEGSTTRITAFKNIVQSAPQARAAEYRPNSSSFQGTGRKLGG